MLSLVLKFRRLPTYTVSSHISSAPRDWETDVGITGKAADLLWHSLAPATCRIYRVGQTTFAEFATRYRFTPAFHVQFDSLSQFITITAEETSVSTVKSYLNHLRSYHIDHNNSTAVFVDEQIQRMLKGALPKHGTKPTQSHLEIARDPTHNASHI
jgi:hypothetical protein